MITPDIPGALAALLLVAGLAVWRRWPWFAATLTVAAVVFARPWIAAHLPALSAAWEPASRACRWALWLLALRFLWACALAVCAWDGWPRLAALAGLCGVSLALVAWALSHHPRADESIVGLALVCYPPIAALAFAALASALIRSKRKENVCQP